jgi:exodeoxyribonuclease VII small subunit
MSGKNKAKQKKFEVSLERLEQIVSELESDDIELDTALKLYEEGISLSRYCNEKINEAERKIEILKNGGTLKKEIEEKGEVKSTPEMELFSDM